MDTENNDNLSSIKCNDKDVISFGDDTFKIDRLRTAVNLISNQGLANQLKNLLNAQRVNISASTSSNWFKEGINCEILTLGATKWRKGKMKFKLSLEFYVEEEEDNTTSETIAESPLDDIRRQISETTS